MSTYLVRPATLHDARAIAEIHAAYSRTSVIKQDKAPIAPALNIDRQQVFWREAVEFAEPQLLVACEEKTVVGFAGFDRSRDPATPPTQGEIWFIHVLAEHWGRGAGLALWDGAREGLIEEGCTQVSVWIPLAAERALRFHELAGFKKEMSTARTTPVNGGGRIEEIRLKRKL